MGHRSMKLHDIQPTTPDEVEQIARWFYASYENEYTIHYYNTTNTICYRNLRSGNEYTIGVYYRQAWARDGSTIIGPTCPIILHP